MDRVLLVVPALMALASDMLVKFRLGFLFLLFLLCSCVRVPSRDFGGSLEANPG